MIRDGRARGLVSNAAFLGAARIANLTISAAISVITARVLGPHGRGIYSLPGINAALTTTFSAGLFTATSYFLLNKRSGSTLRTALFAAFALFVLAGAGMTVSTALLNGSLWLLGPSLAMVPAYALYTAACGYFTGRNRLRTAALTNVSMTLVTLIIVSGTLFVTHGSARWAATAWAAGTAVVGIIAIGFVLIDSGTLAGRPVDPRDFIAFASKAGLVNVVNLLNYRVDILIVAALSPVAVLGQYSLAVTGAESALSVATSLAQAAMPRVGHLEAGAAAAFTARCVRNSFFAVGLVCAVIAALADTIVTILFGEAFRPLITPLRILLVGVVAASASSMLSNYFVLNRGRMRVPLYTSALSATICGFLTILLVPKIGMTGAALASTVAYIASQTVAIAIFCRETKMPVAHVLFIDAADLRLYTKLVRRVFERRP